MSIESPQHHPERSESTEENLKKIEALRGPFLAAVKAELEKMKAAGKITPEEALQKWADAGTVDVALTEKDGRLFAWQGIVSQDELQKIAEEK